MKSTHNSLVIMMTIGVFSSCISAQMDPVAGVFTGNVYENMQKKLSRICLNTFAFDEKTLEDATKQEAWLSDSSYVSKVTRLIQNKTGNNVRILNMFRQCIAFHGTRDIEKVNKRMRDAGGLDKLDSLTYVSERVAKTQEALGLFLQKNPNFGK